MSTVPSDDFDDIDEELLSEVLTNFNSQHSQTQLDHNKTINSKVDSETDDFSFDDSELLTLTQIAQQLSSKNQGANNADFISKEPSLLRFESCQASTSENTQPSQYSYQRAYLDQKPFFNFENLPLPQIETYRKRKIQASPLDSAGLIDYSSPAIVKPNSSLKAACNPNAFAELFLKPSTSKKENKTTNHFCSETISNKKKLIQEISQPVFDLKNKLWADNFCPSRLEDVVIHSSKIKEVRTWLQKALVKNSKSKILILSGPSGSGKSTILKLVAQELGAQTVEWTGPQFLPNNPLENQATFDQVSVLNQFNRFLRSSLYFRSIISNNDYTSQIVVLDEFLNIDQISTRQSIQNILISYCNDSRSTYPLVILMSDVHNFLDTDSDRHQTGYLFTARDLVPIELFTQGLATRITFNPVAVSFIKKALIHCLQLRYDTIIDKKSFLNKPLSELAETAQGDVRAAINSLQLRCFGCPSLHYVDCDKELSSNTTLSLFHLIGKIFYCKWAETNSNMNLELESILQICPVELSRLTDFLFHNYPGFAPTPEQLSIAADGFSLAQSLIPPWGRDPHPQASQLMLCILSTRALLSSLKCNSRPMSRQKILCPAAWQARRDQAKNQSLINRTLWQAMTSSKNDYMYKKKAEMPYLKGTTANLMITELLPYLSKMKRVNTELDSLVTFKVNNFSDLSTEFRENDDVYLASKDYDSFDL